MTTPSKLSLREQILGADDIESRLVSVPEWGDVVIEMRTPTVRRRGELIAQFIENDTVDYVRMLPALILATACDPETHQALFTEDDLDALAGKSAKAMERLGEVATELSGLENAQQRLDAGKGGSTTTANGSTRSPSPSGSSARSPNSTPG